MRISPDSKRCTLNLRSRRSRSLARTDRADREYFAWEIAALLAASGVECLQAACGRAKAQLLGSARRRRRRLRLRRARSCASTMSTAAEAGRMSLC